MRKFLTLIPALLVIASCDRLGKSVPSEEELLQEELRTINWKEVDEYPSVSECEKLEDKALRRSCFFEFLSTTLQQRLDSESISNMYPNLDTIQVRVTVFPDSTLKFEPQFPADSLTYRDRKIDSILQSRLSDLPKISPAINRGIPVKSQFNLPVILKSE